MSGTTDAFSIDMPSFDVQALPADMAPAPDTSNFQMPSFQPDPFASSGVSGATDAWGNANSSPSLPATPSNNAWATDSEMNSTLSGQGVSNSGGVNASGGGFLDSVWNFVSSDKMLNALNGMAKLGLKMWGNSLVKNATTKPTAYTRSSSGGGSGGSGKATVIPSVKAQTYKRG